MALGKDFFIWAQTLSLLSILSRKLLVATLLVVQVCNVDILQCFAESLVPFFYSGVHHKLRRRSRARPVPLPPLHPHPKAGAHPPDMRRPRLLAGRVSSRRRGDRSRASIPGFHPGRAIF